MHHPGEEEEEKKDDDDEIETKKSEKKQKKKNAIAWIVMVMVGEKSKNKLLLRVTNEMIVMNVMVHH